LALLAWLVGPDLPSVFTTNDAVLSWNRWALSWAADEVLALPWYAYSLLMICLGTTANSVLA
jgi:hypothetical protein